MSHSTPTIQDDANMAEYAVMSGFTYDDVYRMAAWCGLSDIEEFLNSKNFFWRNQQ